jgi:hypothetical protein
MTLGKGRGLVATRYSHYAAGALAYPPGITIQSNMGLELGNDSTPSSVCDQRRFALGLVVV